PANLMITPAGDAKIMGFGTAAFHSSGDSRAGLGAHEVCYMAPELLEGAAPDPRADVFSAGVLAYELLSGRQPFIGPNVAAGADKLPTGGPDPPLRPRSKYPPRLGAIVLKPAAREPSRRHQTMDEACAELESLGFDTASLFLERMSAEPQRADD